MAKVGRPRMFETPEDMQKAIDAYFAENPERPTISGMAVHLGFCDRSSLYEYAERPEFTHTVKLAVSRIEAKHEENIYTTGAAGSIFWLKNRGWTDQQQIQHSGGINIQPVEWVKSEDQ